MMTPKLELCAVQQVVAAELSTKCGVLKASNASAWNLNCMFSRNFTAFESDKLKFTIPGAHTFPGTELP